MSKSVLLVEDQAVVALDVAEILSEIGFEVAGRAASAGEALDHIWRERPDAAVMDLHAQSGEQLLHVADELEDLAVPFLFLSEEGPGALPPRFRSRPFILKPFQPADLAVAVARIAGVPTPWRPATTPTRLRHRLVRRDLDEAQRIVEEAEERIVRVELLVARYPIDEGIRLLAQLRTSLATMVRYRDHIRRGLARGD